MRHGSLVVGQAPEEVVSVVLTSEEGRVTELLAEDAGVGRFLVAPRVSR